MNPVFFNQNKKTCLFVTNQSTGDFCTNQIKNGEVFCDLHYYLSVKSDVNSNISNKEEEGKKVINISPLDFTKKKCYYIDIENNCLCENEVGEQDEYYCVKHKEEMKTSPLLDHSNIETGLDYYYDTIFDYHDVETQTKDSNITDDADVFSEWYKDVDANYQKTFYQRCIHEIMDKFNNLINDLNKDRKYNISSMILGSCIGLQSALNNL